MAEADNAGELTPDELEVLAQATWWVGRPDTAREAWERAYTLHAKAGQAVRRQCGRPAGLQPPRGRPPASAQRLGEPGRAPPTGRS
jgi:hypothetical protein